MSRTDESTSRIALANLVRGSRRIVAVTGAGVSTASGIPDYRDEDGNWKRRPPVNVRDFLASPAVRRRYWARAMVGWDRFSASVPNDAHRALARLEESGRVHLVITQNVDRLHQRAGSRRVLDLHGRLDRVECLDCRAETGRTDMQARLREANPSFTGRPATVAPDGDADLEAADFGAFDVPSCATCGGVLKPSVVFFGEAVPRERVEAAYGAVGEADLVLVAGSSLTVWSGYRFVKAAAERDVPVAIVNRGRTRADDLATVRVEGDCGEVLKFVVLCLAPHG